MTHSNLNWYWSDIQFPPHTNTQSSFLDHKKTRSQKNNRSDLCGLCVVCVWNVSVVVHPRQLNEAQNHTSPCDIFINYIMDVLMMK